jgi:hypothetical protein
VLAIEASALEGCIAGYEQECDLRIRRIIRERLSFYVRPQDIECVRRDSRLVTYQENELIFGARTTPPGIYIIQEGVF